MSGLARPIYEEPSWREPPADSEFGPIVSGFEIEQAIAQLIVTWMPWYLLAIEKQRGWEEGRLPTFKSMVAATREADRLRDDRFPALAIVSPGIQETPQVAGNGTYRARWRIDCQAVCVAAGDGEARRLGQLYAAAMRSLLLQAHEEPVTELGMLGIDWAQESYTIRNPAEARTLGEGIVRTSVHVNRVLDRSLGPRTPPPIWTLPTVRETDVDVTKKED